MVEFAQRFTTTAASNQQSYQHTERVNQQTIDNLVTRQEFDNMRADLTFKHTQLIEGLKTKTLITSAVAKGSVQTNIPTRLSSSSSSSSSSYQSVPIASPSGQILWLPNIATNSWMHRLFRFLILSSGMSGCDQAVFILPHWVELLTNVHVNGQWIMKDDWDIENYIEQFKKEAKDSVDQVASGIAEVNLERLRLRKIDIQERRENLEKFAGALKELSKQQEWGTRGPKDDDVLTETMLPLLATSTGMAAIKTALCKITLARLNKGKYYTLKGILSDTEMTTWFSRYVGCQYIDLTIRGGQVKSADVIARAKMNEQNALSCRMYFDPPKPIK